ncbi:MAG: hypothetical protein JWO59_3309 [Chloroflexi bacterium]|nr:hypothetical protein [Chloroflexota bacterium]
MYLESKLGEVTPSVCDYPTGPSESVALDDVTRVQIETLREDLLEHFASVGPSESSIDASNSDDAKNLIRRRHAFQRAEYRARELAFVTRYGRELLSEFAQGDEVTPSAIQPVVCPVVSETKDSRLFRLATLLWSVPVSRGYGRRMRFLVRDANNGKLAGLFALTDPVFNLRARDNWIAWSVEDRRQRLVNLMDAHVVGAVPPYSQLLGGKMVTALMTSQEVCTAFSLKYGSSQGIISREEKRAQLVLLTVTSSLGRSSLYNRLRLPGTVDFQRLGLTEGWGHFQVPDALFSRMRQLLAKDGHSYAAGHEFGQGPNWRLRVIRVALRRLGLDQNLLRHGIAREVFAAPLADGWREYLCGQSSSVALHRPSVATIGAQAVERWVIGRANRFPDYREWTRDQTWRLLTEAAHVARITQQD